MIRPSVLALCCAIVIGKSVLFIAVDDLRPEHGIYGGHALTPNIDAFAQSALVFNRNYVQIGVCSPSRASLLTGRYPDTTHINDLWHYFRDSGCNVTTLPQAFLDAGYITRGSSKIFHPGHASGLGDDWSSAPCGPSCAGFHDPPSWGGYFEPPSQSLSPWNITDGPSWMALNETEFPIDSHPDVQSALHIAGLLASLANSTAPFFLAAGTLKPHLPFIFPARFLEPYTDYNETAVDAPAATDEAIASWTAWGELSSYADIKPIAARFNLSTPGAQMPREKALELRRGYFAATSFNDYCVGLLLDALEASGRSNDTVVVLWGDHGWQLGDHSDWTKHTNFESVARAPLLIRAPGYAAAAGKVTQAFTQHIDIAPTLLELAGLPPQAGFQGLSLVPILDNPSLTALPGRGPYAYSQYPRETSACSPPALYCDYAHAMGYTIRTPEWRYTEWVAYDNKTFTPDWTVPFNEHKGNWAWAELYDHRGDNGTNWELFENANLIADSSYAGVVANLSALLHAGPNLLHPKVQ